MICGGRLDGRTSHECPGVVIVPPALPRETATAGDVAWSLLALAVDAPLYVWHLPARRRRPAPGRQAGTG